MTNSYEVNDNNAAQALDYNQHSARWQYSVQNGCAVSINSGNLGQSDTLSVASGDIFFNGNSVTVSSQNVQIDSSNTDPRKDVVYLDTNGSAQVSKGTAEAKQPSGATKFDAYRPAPNDLTGTDTTIIAEVFVPGGASSITASDLRDRRQFADVSVKSLTTSSQFTDPGGFTYTDTITPVQVTEEASTFAESGVTVTHNKTEVNQNSIRLATDTSTASRPADDTSQSTSESWGLVINPNSDLESIEVTLSGNMGTVQDVFLTDGSETILDEKTAGYSNGDTVTLSGPLTAGNTYHVGVYDNGNSYTLGKLNTGSYPYTSTYIDITDGVLYPHPDDSFAPSGGRDPTAIVDVKGVVKRTSGDALVEWDTGVPADISSWDLATFQETLDNETVTVDVEDGNGNTLFSDIGQNFDISTVDTSKEVKLRANLSRSSTSNNPTCDYLARRFTR